MLSSNFMMYPFGNFLPFNDIVKLSAQTSTIDRAYLDTIANSAQYKFNNGYGEEYGTLATQLRKFFTLMDDAYGTGWTASDAMNKYFALSGIPKTFDQNEELLQNIYSIDYDEPTDFYFGMEMKMNFMQPKNGITGPNNDQNMVFYFTGDDDVWVYIDDVLFLDLSGIHRHVGGEIDFVNGLVKYYSLDVSTGDVGATPFKTVSFSDLVSDGLNEKGTFENYSKHSFNFYYMERGSGSGVCRMNFNFPLLRQNTVSVTKELSVDEEGKPDLLGNPDFRFQILKENGTELFIGGNTPYDILDTTGTVIGSGVTDENGVFLLKANQTAVFNGVNENSGRYFVRELLSPDAFQQYGQITVDGSSVTTGTGSNVIVGSDTFTGVDSPVKDVSDGSTAFRFDNQITFNKLGSLQITKRLELYPVTREMLQFQFYVTLDGEPLPIGTQYTVGSETRTVTEEGIINLAPDETGLISNIIAGSRFTVRETAASGAGYLVMYEGNELTQESDETGGFVSGTIKTDSAVDVTVKNSEKGAGVTIPAVKYLTNPDGAEYSFSFRLEQVTDSSGDTLVDGGTVQTATAAFPQGGNDTSSAFQFQLTYLEKNMQTLPVVFYYRITEQQESTGQVLCDSSRYVAEVTVKQESDSLTASVTALWKNGVRLESTDLPLSYTNTLLNDLIIGKKVAGGVSPDTMFEFKVTLKEGEVPLSGSFSAVKSISDGNKSEEAQPPVDLNENGSASILLKHGEKLRICGIPVGTSWTVTEEEAAGYQVSFQINAGDSTDGVSGSGTISGSGNTNSIIFTNAGGYELPETGGIGTHRYVIGGWLLTAVAGFFLLYKYNKRRKEDFASF